MNQDSQPATTAVLPSNTPAHASRKFQFSLSALMLLTLTIAVGCAALRWLGSVWFVPVLLAVLAAASVMMALRHRPNPRMLALSYWHFAIWLALGAVASGLTVHGCQNYNAVAGTDKTPGHMVQISAAALAGPMVGPVANSAAGEVFLAQASRMAAVLLAILFVSVSPFLFVRRVVPLPIAVISWIGFIAASILWFFSAMISLGVFLS